MSAVFPSHYSATTVVVISLVKTIFAVNALVKTQSAIIEVDILLEFASQ